jgi:hypothetical protein
MQCLGPRRNPSEKAPRTTIQKPTSQSVLFEWRRSLFSSTNLIGWIAVKASGFFSESWIGPLQPTSLFLVVSTDDASNVCEKVHHNKNPLLLRRFATCRPTGISTRCACETVVAWHASYNEACYHCKSRNSLR